MSTDDHVLSPEQQAAREFAAAYADDWEARLRRNKQGAVIPNLANAVAILEHDPAWAGVLGYDEFSGRVVKRIGPPFALRERGEWTDLDDRRTMLWLTENYHIEPRDRLVFDAVQLMADRNRFHARSVPAMSLFKLST